MGNQIYKLSFGVASDRERLAASDTIDLGINSKKSLLLLNRLITWRRDRCTFKANSYRYSSSDDRVSGGGLLVKGSPRMMVDDLGKTFIYFSSSYKVDSYIRTANSKNERRNSILDKFANELKKMWKVCSVNDEMQVMIRPNAELTTSTYSNKIYLDMTGVEVFEQGADNEFIKITLNEYRALHEYLKNRPKEKNIDRNGKVAYNSMIGEQIEDQFLLSAVETITNAINEANVEFEKAKKEFQAAAEETGEAVKKERDEKISAASNIMNNKIEELKAQLEDLKKMAAAANEMAA